MSQSGISRANQTFFAKWESALNGGLFLTASAIIGSTRLIEWIKGPVTREGVLLTSLVNGGATIAGSMLAKKYPLDSSYHQIIIAISSIGLGSFVTPYIASTLSPKTFQISLPAALTIGAAHLLIKLTTYSLNKLSQHSSYVPEVKTPEDVAKLSRVELQEWQVSLEWAKLSLPMQMAFNRAWSLQGLKLIHFTTLTQGASFTAEEFLIIEEAHKQDMSQEYTSFLYNNNRARVIDYTKAELSMIPTPQTKKAIDSLSDEQIKWHHYLLSLDNSIPLFEEVRKAFVSRFSALNLQSPAKPIKTGAKQANEGKRKTILPQETKLKDYFSWNTFPQQPGPRELELALPDLRQTLANLTKEEAEFLATCESFYRIIEHTKYRSATTAISAANIKILAEGTLYIDGFDAGMKAIIDQLVLGVPDLENKVKVLAETGHPGLTDLCLGVKVELISGPKSIMAAYNKKRIGIEQKRKTERPAHYNKTKYEGNRYLAPGDVYVPPPPVERELPSVWEKGKIIEFIANIEKLGAAFKEDYFRLVETMEETSLNTFADLLTTMDLLKKFYSLEKQVLIGATSLENRQLRLQTIFKRFTETQIINSAKISVFWEVLSNFDDRFVNSAIGGFTAEQFTSIIENMAISFEILGFFSDFIKKIKKPDDEKNRAIVRNQVANIHAAYNSPTKAAEIKEQMFKDPNAKWEQFLDRNNNLKGALVAKARSLRAPGTS